MKTRSYLSWLAVLALGTLAAFWVVRSPDSIKNLPTDSISTPAHLEDVGIARSTTGTVRPIVYSDNLRVGASIEKDGVFLSFTETPPGGPPTPEAEVITYFFATSFLVQEVAGRQSSEVFVLGVDGEIEKWTQEVPNGSIYLQIKPPSSVPTTMPEFETGIKNGTYVPIRDRRRELRQRRDLILPKYPDVQFTGLSVDPEGRYLLLFSMTPHGVYQLSLEPGSKPEEIATEGQIPELALCQHGYLAHHSTLGRLFIHDYLEPGIVGLSRLIFIDAANDGVFESTMSLTDSQWVAQGFDGPVWLAASFYDYSTQ